MIQKDIKRFILKNKLNQAKRQKNIGQLHLLLEFTKQ